MVQLSYHISSCEILISASLSDVIWPSSGKKKKKIIKTNANVHIEIMWWFLECYDLKMIQNVC